MPKRIDRKLVILVGVAFVVVELVMIAPASWVSSIGVILLAGGMVCFGVTQAFKAKYMLGWGRTKALKHLLQLAGMSYTHHFTTAEEYSRVVSNLSVFRSIGDYGNFLKLWSGQLDIIATALYEDQISDKLSEVLMLSEKGSFTLRQLKRLSNKYSEEAIEMCLGDRSLKLDDAEELVKSVKAAFR